MGGLWRPNHLAAIATTGAAYRRRSDPPVAPICGAGRWGVKGESELKFGLVAAGGLEPPTYRV